MNEKAPESKDLSPSPSQTSSEQASHKLLADSQEKPGAPKSPKSMLEEAASLSGPALAFLENARAGLIAPIQATAELYDHATGFKTADKIAQIAAKPKESEDAVTRAFATAGSAAGTALWMILLHKGGTAGVSAWKDTKVLTTGQHVGISAGTGLFFGSVLTPTGSSDKDWVTHRLQNGVASSLAFATLTRSTAFLGKAGIRNPIVAGFISGVPGGIVDTESRYVMGQSDNANPLAAIETYSILGGAFGATSVFKAPIEPLAKAPLPKTGEATVLPTSKVAPESRPERPETKQTYPPETNGYTGYFVSPESKVAITNNLTIDGQKVPMKWEPARTFHVTEAFGVKAGAIEPWLNENKTTPPNLKAIGYAVDNTGVEALLVSKNGEIKRSDGKYYHVTRSLAEGRTANESIGLLDKAMSIQKAQVEGRDADIDPADAQRYSFRALKPEDQFSLSAQPEFHVSEQTEKAARVATPKPEVAFESLSPRDQVVTAIKNTPADYLKRAIETRTPEHRAGSYFDLSANKLREALFRANWEPYDPLDSEGNHIISGGARGYRATIAGGRLGMISTDAVTNDAQLYLIDPKGTGKWSVSTVGTAEPQTDTATMIVGPNEAGTQNQIWTFHPGDPVRGSQLDSSTMSGLLKDAGALADGLPENGLGRRIPISKAQLDRINAGLPDSAKMTLVKIESADNIPAPVTQFKPEVNFDSLPPREQVVSAINNTPSDYLTRTIETRTPEHRAGSYFDLSANELQEALSKANWEPYDPLDSEGNHIIAGGARGYRATISGGRLGMISTDAVTNDAQLYLIDPKGTGKWSVSTVGTAEPHTDTATMIVGPNEAGTQNQIWTFHPGDPVRGSQLDSSTMSVLLKDAGVSADGLPENGLGRRIPISKAQLDRINAGLPDSAKMTLAKIESADNVPPPAIPESSSVQAIPNFADRAVFKQQLSQLPEEQRQGYESALEHAVKNPNEVARTTAVRGLTFEMSRLNRTLTQGQETVIANPPQSEPVTYRGFPRKATNLAEPPLETKKSPILFDIALQRENAAPYAYEVKSSPRMLYGEETQQLNQVLKYQQAIDDGTISGATIEVTGRVSPDLVHWLNGKNVGDTSAAPDVEVLYSMPLPSGADYTFILKRAQGDNGLKFTNDDKVYTPEDKKIIAGAYKAIQDRTIGDIISGTHLDNAPDTLAAYARNPMTIKHLNEFNQYDAVRQENIWAKLDAKNNSDRINAANPRNVVSEYNTREYVEEATRWYQDHLRQNPQASKSKQAYLIGSEDGIEHVVGRAYDRAQVIKNFEETRAASQTEQARREDRAAKGYTGRPEGVSLDMEHIIMDATAEENKSASRRGRNYDSPERFMTVDQVTDYLDGQDRHTVDANIYDPISGKTTSKSNLSEKELGRTNTAIESENLQRAKTRVGEMEQRFGELSNKQNLSTEEADELKFLNSRHNGWNMQKGSILKAEEQLTEISKERKAAGAQKKGPTEGQTKEEFIASQKERAAQFDSQVNALNQQLKQRYKEVMGGDNEWNKIAKHVDAKESNIIKFMYVVNADGSVPLTEEVIRGEVTGRAAHSELAQGRNVYGAGELVFTKSADTGRWVLSEINNASGHYRPPGTETLTYVRNQIQSSGVDVSHAILNDALQRGTPLVDAHLMDGGP